MPLKHPDPPYSPTLPLSEQSKDLCLLPITRDLKPHPDQELFSHRHIVLRRDLYFRTWMGGGLFDHKEKDPHILPRSLTI